MSKHEANWTSLNGYRLRYQPVGRDLAVIERHLDLSGFFKADHIGEQECIPVGCVPPAAVAVPGGLHQEPSPDQAPPWEQTPLHQTPPWTRHPLGTRHLPVNRMTDRCKNITLPQTSFAGGNYKHEGDVSVQGILLHHSGPLFVTTDPIGIDTKINLPMCLLN